MNVLLSMKPKYVEKVLSGEKKYEFRKRIWKKEVDRVFIYSTSPVKRIVASFKPGEIVEGPPEELWNQFSITSGINKDDFFDYFRFKDKGFAIKIKELEIFDEPVDPYSAIKGFRASVGFRYIDDEYEILLNHNKDEVLSERWFKKHLEYIKNKAGARYTPELNIELPISAIFNGISRTKSFYSEIRKNFGNISHEFNYITSNFERVNLQDHYNIFKKEIDELLIKLDNIKDYNTDKIPWDDIKEQSIKSKELSWILVDTIREIKEKGKNNRPNIDENKSYRSLSENYDLDLNHIHKVREKLNFFVDFSSSSKAKLANHPFLLLTGPAGNGKTHLLCDVVEQRIKNEKDLLPAILVFGEFFSNGMDFWYQVFKQLEIEHIIKNKEDFLKTLNNTGKKAKSRSLFIIDALNENISHASGFWKSNLSNIIQEIEKYPNIALIVSIRSGFENEILTEKQKPLFINEEHQGFRFREWEAIDKFFKTFSLPLPEIPLLMPEFENPLFLLLFCKAFKKRKKKKNKQIFRGHEGATYIFESFIKNATDIIAREFKISKDRFSNPAYRIWSEIIKEISSEMVNQNDERIPIEKLNRIINKAYPQVNIGKFARALESNMLVMKVPRYGKGQRTDGFDVIFPFQKFSDHLIGRYIFKKYENEFGKTNKNIQTARKFFSKRRKLGIFLSKNWNRGIIEALSIQCPEQLKGIEFIEVAPYLIKDDYFAEVAENAFIESLIWRNPKAFSTDGKNTLKIINKNVIKTETGHHHLLNAFLSVASIPNHPFNAERLHQHLSNFSMPKRDSWWSTFLHDQYGKHGAVDRLIQWAWSDHDKTNISDESILLTSITLSWFFTTSNRYVRDKSTKGLVSLLQNRIHLIPKLLARFKDVNDPYVIERLYAVAYGCVLRNQDDFKNINILADWIYNNIFKDNEPPTHILLRDYARGIIEVSIKNGIKLEIDMKKVNPPYHSIFPSELPSNKDIDKYKFEYKSKDFQDYYWSQNNIISSMTTEYGRGTSMYGDFGRYTFQHALCHWDLNSKNIDVQQLSNLAVKEIFNMGYNVELHGEFDRIISRYHHTERFRSQPERIGKKYQWIAFHKILAIVSDNFSLKDHVWNDSTKKFEGPWHPFIRDIDPSFISHNDDHIKKLVTFSQWKINHGYYNVWEEKRQNLDWIKDYCDIPNPINLIQLNDDNENEWIMLEGFIKWEEENPPEYNKYDIPFRELWLKIKCNFTDKDKSNEIIQWLDDKEYPNNYMPKYHNFHECFLGEYPNYKAFIDLRISNSGIENEYINEELKIPIIISSNSYLNEFALDRSHEGTISIELPSPTLIKELGLIHINYDGIYFDEQSNLAAYCTSIFEDNIPSALLIKKSYLMKFLKIKDCNPIWTIMGEKQMIGGNHSIEEYIGKLIIMGRYTLKNGKIEGDIKCKYRK